MDRGRGVVARRWPYPCAPPDACRVIRGYPRQDKAKLAIEIAAAGRQDLPMTVSPGSGKALLAGAMASTLPPRISSESLK